MEQTFTEQSSKSRAIHDLSDDLGKYRLLGKFSKRRGMSITFFLRFRDSHAYLLMKLTVRLPSSSLESSHRKQYFSIDSSSVRVCYKNVKCISIKKRKKMLF